MSLSEDNFSNDMKQKITDPHSAPSFLRSSEKPAFRQPKRVISFENRRKKTTISRSCVRGAISAEASETSSMSMKVSQSTRPKIDVMGLFATFLQVKPLFSESNVSGTPRQTTVPVDEKTAFEEASIARRRRIYRKYAYEVSFCITVQTVKGAQTTALPMKMRVLACSSG